MKTGTNEANFVKIVQGIRPLWGVYIPHFDQISVKISVFGVPRQVCVCVVSQTILALRMG